MTATFAPLAIDNNLCAVQLSIGKMHKGRNMLTLDKIRDLLTDRRLNMVAEATGIHRNTLTGIRSGKIDNPSYDTVRKLSAYLGGTENAS